MKAFHLHAAIFIAQVARVAAQQGPWQQCGGINWTGGTTCTAGWTCVYQNPYYSQCLQVSSSTTPTVISTPSSTASSTAEQTGYGQCGGMNWQGATQCTSGWTCVYQNPYYSQCLQASSTSTPTPVTSSTTTNTGASAAVQTQYGQCGGTGWSGPTQCTTGWTCVYQNPYYSQCLQPSSTSTPTTTSAPSSTGSSGAVQTQYGQCGGSGWTGPTTCPSGWTCVYQNAYYSQCLQTSSTTVSTTVLSSSTTQISSSTTTASDAVQTPYGQCGGQGWSGPTTCTSGWTCQYQNAYYSQCLQPGSSSATTTSSASTTAPTQSTTTSSPPVPSSSSVSSQTSSSSSTPASSGGGIGPTYKASITHYGAGDTFGSPNCNTNTAACGFYTYPGYSAAISENFYGAGPGQGAGPACGTCWRVTGYTDSSGNRLSNYGTTVVVMINNLCPAQGNPLCAQNGMSGTNQYGANVNFDLCSDSGAQQAFFGNDGQGLAVGVAVQVDCSQWSGTIQH